MSTRLFFTAKDATEREGDMGGQRMDVEKVAAEVLNAAFAVHTALGAGLLESAYEACLLLELRKRGVLNHPTAPLRAPSRPSR